MPFITVYRSLLKWYNFIIKSQNTALERLIMIMVMKYSGRSKFHKLTSRKIHYYAILAMLYLGTTCLKSLMCWIDDGILTDNSSMLSSTEVHQPRKICKPHFCILSYNFYLIMMFLADFPFSLTYDSWNIGFL